MFCFYSFVFSLPVNRGETADMVDSPNDNNKQQQQQQQATSNNKQIKFFLSLWKSNLTPKSCRLYFIPINNGLLNLSRVWIFPRKSCYFIQEPSALFLAKNIQVIITLKPKQLRTPTLISLAGAATTIIFRDKIIFVATKLS